MNNIIKENRFGKDDTETRIGRKKKEIKCKQHIEAEGEWDENNSTEMVKENITGKLHVERLKKFNPKNEATYCRQRKQE